MKKYIIGRAPGQTINFNTMKPLAGLILCGGQSARMGEDKCFLQYHGKPQWQHLAEILASICAEVVVSCTDAQLTRLSQGLPSLHQPLHLLADLPEFAGHGPMSGLLTGFHQFPGHSFVLVGCDYPLLTVGELQALSEARGNDHHAVCFYREMEKVDEPLVAIYENSSHAPIREAFNRGDYSLRSVLQQIMTNRLKAGNANHLQSIDTPEAFHQAWAQMNPKAEL